MATTKDLAQAIRHKLARDPKLAAAVEFERLTANVASEIYDARCEAGLTQQQLADLVGMHQSAIARLEDADYDGHSLKTLHRIAQALRKRVEIRFANPRVGVAVETSKPAKSSPSPKRKKSSGRRSASS